MRFPAKSILYDGMRIRVPPSALLLYVIALPELKGMAVFLVSIIG
jgi:hypothetical protein